MNLKTLFSSLKSSAGFTMIELLVVIAVIGVLAVAVLSSINPIEQINKGRDTRTRSDAAQLINAVDRYYAIHEKYPWNVANGAFNPTLAPDPIDEFYYVGTAGTPSGAEFEWIDLLVDTGEVKEGFTNRLKQDNSISVFKISEDNATMYACFLPTSLGFKQEAMDNCNDGTTPDTGATAGGIDPCPVAAPNAAITDLNYICLP